MLDYYYLIPQLPTLVFGQKSPISRDSFFAETEKWLSAEVVDRLKEIDLLEYAESDGDPEVIKRYKAFERDLRTDIARFRQARRSGGEYTPGSFPLSWITDHSPLDTEKLLLQLRWNMVDSLEFGHDFDLGFLMLYFLKMQIQERLTQFHKRLGEETFMKLCEAAI